jgi:hypothetical protein
MAKNPTALKVEEQTAPATATVTSTVAPAQPTYNEDEYAKCQNTSQRIRFLAGAGWTRGSIAKKLGKKYQHVRNVLIQPVKKASAPTS